MDQPLPPPGFYPDPSGSGHQRWWDGTAWTQHLAPVAPVPPPAAFAPMSADPATAAPLATLAHEATATSVMPAAALATATPTRRVSPPIVVLLVVLLAVVGGLGYFLTKGSSSKKPTAAAPVGTAAGAALHAAGKPQPAPTLKQRLQAINLVQTDLAIGYVAQPDSGDDSLPKGTKVPPCYKQLVATKHSDEVSTGSPDFVSAAGQISSSADLQSSPAVVRGDLAKAATSTLPSCLQQFAVAVFTQVVSGSGASLGQVQVGRMTNLGPSSFGFRITSVLVAPGGVRQRVLYLDIIGFAVGRAEIGLDVTTFGAAPDGQLEGTLVATLRQRAQQAQLPS